MATTIDTFKRVTDIVALLKACAKQKDVHKGTSIHADIVKWGLLTENCYVVTTLVSMYAKCAALAKAAAVLDETSVPNVVTWNALLAGYVQQGQGEEAFKCFDQMQRAGLSPNTVSFICILKACGIVKDVEKGKQFHDEITIQGLLEKDIVLGNTLVDMYARCGALAKAAQVLDELPVRDVVSWNALIAGYVQQGKGEEALKLFERMQSEGVFPDAVTFISILKCCSGIDAFDKGQRIHDEISRLGLLHKNIVLGTSLVDMYAKCGALAKAAQVLKELPVRNVVTWSSLIAGHAQQGQGEEALKCFEQMQREGISANTVTFISVLQACGSIGAADKGEKIHDEIVRRGLLRNDVVLGNTLVDMYAKCGAMGKALRVLEGLSVRNIVCWNSLIAGYVKQGQGEEALKCLKQMQREGLSPDTVTYISFLKACSGLGAVDKGEQIHHVIVKQHLLEKDIVLGTTLVDMYAKCGALAKAAQVLNELPARNAVAWNALIAGYAQQGQGKEALKCFERMQHEGFPPNEVTFICILKACGSIGAADEGQQIHNRIEREGFLVKDVAVGNALVDMYAKCGALSKAARVLDELPIRDVVSWSALIAGYAQQAQGEEALKCLERMQREGLSPNAVTFASTLALCSRSGHLNEGQIFLANMCARYGIAPDLEHQTSMVDLLGRAGEIDKALAVIKRMPTLNDLPVWLALLGACRQFGNVKLGRLAFDNAVQIDKYDAAAYVLMTEIYAGAGLEEDARNIKAMREKHCREEARMCHMD